MRQVFSSARIENVQAVAKLLAGEGIEVRVEDGQRYRRSIRGGFSYRDSGDVSSRASVWVVRSDDQPRARQLLHEAGLLEATPANPSSFLPATGHAARSGSPNRRARFGLGLLVVAAVALAMWLNQFRNPGWDLPAPRQATSGEAIPALDPSLQAISTTDAVYRIPTPPALAVSLAGAVQARAPGAALCLSIDGQEPDAATLAMAAAAGLDAVATPACPAGDRALRVSVSDYRTDGSGAGTIELATAAGDAAPVVRRLDVRREGDRWQLPDTL